MVMQKKKVARYKEDKPNALYSFNKAIHNPFIVFDLLYIFLSQISIHNFLW